MAFWRLYCFFAMRVQGFSPEERHSGGYQFSFDQDEVKQKTKGSSSRIRYRLAKLDEYKSTIWVTVCDF